MVVKRRDALDVEADAAAEHAQAHLGVLGEGESHSVCGRHNSNQWFKPWHAYVCARHDVVCALEGGGSSNSRIPPDVTA